jgi:hypothetical protein
MAHFQSWDSYGRFKEEVAGSRRYIRTDSGDAFLKAVVATCKERLHTIKAGSVFWRAQLGCGTRPVEGMDGYSEDAAYGPSRMKPRRERANEGRANPKGIPVLYVANTAQTAMSEIRPWVGAQVSVAQFKTARELTIVDCSKLHDQYIKLAFLSRTFDAITSSLSEPSSEEVDQIVWAAIDAGFSEPVTSSDDVAEYAPTQILAELFRSEGYDGLAYKSAFGESGFNIALFDIDSARQVNGFLHSVKAVQFEFSKDPHDEYFLRDDGAAIRAVITAIEPITSNKTKSE